MTKTGVGPHGEDLDSLRRDIDAIDDQVLDLLNRRAASALEIGREKRRQGRAVYDPEREAALLKRLSDAAAGPLSAAAVRAVFQRIVQACRNLEAVPRIGALGPRGTFSHQAALHFMGPGVDIVLFHDLADAAEAAARGEVDSALLPAENSIEGIIGTTFDLLVDQPLHVVGEWIEPVRLYLIGAGDLADVKTVYSHPQPFKQAQRWLRGHLPGRPLLPAASTADAAERARAEAGAAAVVGPMIVDEQVLPTIAGPIEDRPDNRTRFWAVAREPKRDGGKSTLMLTLAHAPGSLAQALSVLGGAGVNLTSIVSRPAPNQPWEYRFFLDVDGNARAEPIAGAIRALAAAGAHVRTLGVYDSAESAP